MEPPEDQMERSRLTFDYGVFRWIKCGELPAAPPPKR
jgi:hypothetical protein